MASRIRPESMACNSHVGIFTKQLKTLVQPLDSPIRDSMVRYTIVIIPYLINFSLCLAINAVDCH